MNIKKINKTIITAGAIILSIACCMLPRTYQGSISQSSQEGLIIYDKGVEDLILKVSPQISGEEKLQTFCWLITVPNEPDHYETIKEDIFASLYVMKQKDLVKPLPKSRGLGCSTAMTLDTAKSEAQSIELGRRVKVGAYDIQPVRGIGKNAYSGLNSWLESNDFPTEPQEHMQYFIDNKFTFLCIKVNPADQENGIDSSPQLEPLRMTFKTDKIYYPMKYSSQQGEFSANLYTLTSMPIDYEQSAASLNRLDWSNQGLYKNVNVVGKESLQKVKEILGDRKYEHLYFNNFFCQNPNRDGAISQWQEDIFFSLDNSHQPNRKNMIIRSGISWPRTALLIAIMALAFTMVAKRWKRLKA